jgi:RHS repeat-associated protein
VITIWYDASGKKLRKIVDDRTTTNDDYSKDYLDGTALHNGIVDAVAHPEGRIKQTNVNLNLYQVEYQVQDHLGNTRVMFSDLNNNGTLFGATTAQAEIIQVNHYYPFGMNMEGPWNGSATDRNLNKYQYNGKELNQDFSLDWHDYGARWYDATIGRWHAVDPLAEKMPQWSAYNYVFYNPISVIDPDGRFPIDPKILKQFPKISEYIQNGGGLERYLTGSEKILTTLNKYSSGFLTKEQIHRDFESESSPSIKLVSNQELKERGFKDPSNFSGHFDNTSGTIELGEAFLARIEQVLVKSKGDEKIISSILIEFTDTFVNEYTHYGDFQDGFDMQVKDGTWQNIGVEPSYQDDEGNEASRELFPFPSGLLNYEMYKEGKHIPNNKDESMIPKK